MFHPSKTFSESNGIWSRTWFRNLIFSLRRAANSCLIVFVMLLSEPLHHTKVNNTVYIQILRNMSYRALWLAPLVMLGHHHCLIQQEHRYFKKIKKDMEFAKDLPVIAGQWSLNFKMCVVLQRTTTNLCKNKDERGLREKLKYIRNRPALSWENSKSRKRKCKSWSNIQAVKSCWDVTRSDHLQTCQNRTSVRMRSN